MRRLTFSQPHNLAKFNNELMAAVPALRGQSISGEVRAVCLVEGDGATLSLWVPDDTDDAAVSAVVTAHDPTPVVAPTPADQLKEAVAAATSLDELKTALSDAVDAGQL